MDAARPTHFPEPTAGSRTATAMFRYFPVQSGTIAPYRTVTSRVSSGVRHRGGAGADRYFPVLSGTFSPNLGGVRPLCGGVREPARP